MRLDEFRVGTIFRSDERLWRCTDVGTRVIAAIRIDQVTPHSTQGDRTLNQEEAEAEGWFRGPPYAVLEVLFDEYDQEGCESA
jgi:hypothetical protein